MKLHTGPLGKHEAIEWANVVRKYGFTAIVIEVTDNHYMVNITDDNPNIFGINAPFQPVTYKNLLDNE